MVLAGLLLNFFPVLNLKYDCHSGMTGRCDLDCFKNRMKQQENSIKKGYKKPEKKGEVPKWCPYTSLEDGSDTIAWGHKIKEGEDYDNCTTVERANEIFEEDFSEAYSKAARDYDRIYGEGSFENLQEYKKNVSTDIAFNVGNLRTYPKFMEAMANDDVDGMKEQCGTKGLINRTRFRQCYIQYNSS